MSHFNIGTSEEVHDAKADQQMKDGLKYAGLSMAIAAGSAYYLLWRESEKKKEPTNPLLQRLL